MSKKVLLITIGTGTGPDRVEGLANGIYFSIKTHHPDKIFFMTSIEGQESTLKLVLEKIESKFDYEIESIEDINDIEKIYESSMSILDKIIKDGTTLDNIVVDYTSGTKAMSAGVAIAAVAKEVETLSYIKGKRKDGIVISGKEQIISIRPSQISFDKKIELIKFLFNKNQFDSCSEIINNLKSISKVTELQDLILKFENLCLGYSCWDKFNHQRAAEILLKLKDFENISLKENKNFLGKLNNTQEKTPFLIIDLLNNAERRALEGKYDDAVARLYRIIELIAQFQLKTKYDIDSSDVDLSKIPPELEQKFPHSEKGIKIQISLHKSYELLQDLGDELGEEFFKNKDLINQLQSRNYSILAHGLEPVTKGMYEKLFMYANNSISNIINNAENLKKIAKFQKFRV